MRTGGLVLTFFVLAGLPVFAQRDIAGEWAALYHEDQPHRIPGPELGDYEDLAAYLIRQGWAVSLPGAPFEYTVLERIAEQQGVGVWGFQVGSVRFRHRLR